MLKRTIKDFGISVKKNPVKIVTLFLTLVISLNVIVGALITANTANKEIKNAEEELGKILRLVYIEPEKEVFNFDRDDERMAVIYRDELMTIQNTIYPFGGGLESPILEMLGKVPDYKQSIYTLGLYPGMNHEVYTQVSESDYYPNYLTAIMYGDDYSDPVLEVIEVIEGVDLKEMDSNKVLVNKVMAEKHNLKIGDSLTLDVLVQQKDYEIVGIYRALDDRLNDRTLITTWDGYANITVRNMSSVHENSLITNLHSRLDDHDDAKAIMRLTNRNLEYDNMRWEPLLVDHELLISELLMVRNVMVLVVIIAAALTVFIITKIFEKDIRDNQVNVIKSIYEEDKKKLRKDYKLQITVISLIALLISIYTGIGVANTLGKEITRNIITEEKPLPKELEGEFSIVDYYRESKESAVMQYPEYYEYMLKENLDFDMKIIDLFMTVLVLVSIGGISILIINKDIINKKEATLE